MKTLLDSLPGLPMSVSKVTETVRHMWDQQTSGDAPPMSDFRASQLNLVLHFGLKTTPEEAVRIFETGIEFAQRTPCRIIVLAPVEKAGDSAEPLTAKLFSQCYMGPNLRELCCCEALMLSYPVETASLITHAVSLWLETDLPVYHWFHRVPPRRIQDEYQIYLQRSTRALFDREVEGDAFDAITIGEGTRVVDLALARTLPIRQNLGQFLSNFSPRRLVQGLTHVRLASCGYRAGEGRLLLDWMQHALDTCAERSGEPLGAEFTLETLSKDSEHTHELTWEFADKARFLRWRYDQQGQTGHIAYNLGQGDLQYPLHIENLSGAHALREALFFTPPRIEVAATA